MLLENRETILTRFKALFEDETFHEAITAGT
jgi:hypothetical protein